MLQLVDDVLLVGGRDVSALHEAPLKREAIDLTALIDEALNLVEPSARQASVTLVAPESSAPARAAGDRVRALQVLANLLSNAVKYNRPGGRVTVTVRKVDDRIEVGVSDQGSGLSPESVAKIFQPFERLDAAARGIPGSGLGLAIAKRLTERMNGHIGVHSVPGDGSRFDWSLPAWHEARPQASMAPPVASPTVELQGRVALIEDNEVNASLVQALLGRFERLDLVIFDFFSAALAAPASPAFDLWVIDRQVGTDDALAMLAPLQTRFGAIKAVMYSADTTAASRAVALQAGYLDYWAKPMPMDALLQGLQRWLQPPAAPVRRRAGLGQVGME